MSLYAGGGDNPPLVGFFLWTSSLSNVPLQSLTDIKLPAEVPIRLVIPPGIAHDGVWKVHQPTKSYFYAKKD